MMGGAGWFAWLLPILFPAFIIGGVILLIIFVVKTGTESSSGQKKTPLEILDERYARAEIEEEEYEQRRRKLETYTEKN
ncbi:hypothetical protein AKJ36_01530 [candidate division MSBL1 archaeon SCGC-AAA259I07]|uniref:SHOCT domain-containing protein n=1 Tax=candidate division MSBL1 archaeon SCGC-AAA259I07 TaxID=1698266 RepID=A0A133ULV1_9EURY|nr:hypothetical protein AKJ36_01530 [candidate division MSBL1 archaeon SCGC-AAA259I07]